MISCISYVDFGYFSKENGWGYLSIGPQKYLKIIANDN